MNYKLREPTNEDIAFLSWNLRAEDMKELYATYGHFDALRALTSSVDNSEETHVAIGEDGKPFFIFGMKPHGEKSALIWALATPEITNYKIAFFRQAKVLIRGWFEDYGHVDTMYNFSHSDNVMHHLWLRWCHARILPSLPWGTQKELFTPFVIERKSYV